MTPTGKLRWLRSAVDLSAMLNHLNLGQYSDAFEENGHDDLNFLREQF